MICASSDLLKSTDMNNIRCLLMALWLALCYLGDRCTERKDGVTTEGFVVFRIISHCSGVVHCSNECKSGLRTSCGTDRLFLLYFS